MSCRDGVRLAQYLLQSDDEKTISPGGHPAASSLEEALSILKSLGYSSEEIAQVRAEMMPAPEGLVASAA